MSDTENKIEITGQEDEISPVEEEFTKKKPGLSFMDRKRRHILILLGGRSPDAL